LQMAGIAFIWTAIRLRPIALIQLYAWLAKATTPLAAGRASLYTYTPDHPNRDV
jgi:hypothetical protein